MATANLRPMTIGEVLDGTFRLYRNQFWLFTGIMALPFLLLFVFNVSIAGTARRAVAMSAGGHPTVAPGLIATGLGVGIVAAILTFILTGVGQAATIFAVSDLYLGRPTGIRQAFGRVRGHVLQVLGVIFLTGLLVGVGFVLLIIPGIILMCRTGVAVPVSMLEDESGSTAISRSMDLTKGFAMQMLLVFILVWVLTVAVSAVFTIPFTVMAAMSHQHVLPLGMMILQDVGTFFARILAAPVGTIAFSLMYYNLRVRKEAFDLEHLMGALGPGPTGGASAPGSALPA